MARMPCAHNGSFHFLYRTRTLDFVARGSGHLHLYVKLQWRASFSFISAFRKLLNIKR